MEKNEEPETIGKTEKNKGYGGRRKGKGL